MSRTAIIGSCITRDLWPVRGDAVADLLFISRTSFPSLMCRPLTGFRPAANVPPELGPHQHRALVEDLRKTALQRLVAFQPTHLIFDFIDERFDLLSVADTLVTHSWELEASGYLAQPAFDGPRTVPRLSDACLTLWRDAAAEFAAAIRATPLHRARLILHSSRWAEIPYTEPWRRTPLPLDARAHNALLGEYEAWFHEVMPPMDTVAAPHHQRADPGHRWGLSPFHYVEPYYAEIWSQLEGLGVSPPLAAPSVPAA
jgi:hypothetical protein